LKKGHKRFLVQVLDLAAIGNPTPQEIHEHWTNIVEQNAAGFAVAILHALHQASTRPASLFSYAVDLFRHNAERSRISSSGERYSTSLIPYRIERRDAR
jgi:hypothetical protein